MNLNFVKNYKLKIREISQKKLVDMAAIRRETTFELQNTA